MHQAKWRCSSSSGLKYLTLVKDSQLPSAAIVTTADATARGSCKNRRVSTDDPIPRSQSTPAKDSALRSPRPWRMGLRLTHDQTVAAVRIGNARASARRRNRRSGAAFFLESPSADDTKSEPPESFCPA